MKIVYILLFLTLSFSGISQTNMPDRVVYASAGMHAKPTLGLTLINNKTMTYTVGEPVIYGGLVSSKYIFNGFEQPDMLVAVSPGVVMLEKPGQPFKVYPNPATTQSIVAGPEEQTEAVNIQLMDLNGKLIAEYQMVNNRLVIDFESQLAPGTYFLNFYSLNGSFLQQTKLMKSNGGSN
jgi:hypothetical protein